MKIAIHRRNGSFSDRWIEYCENNRINFIIVNAYSNSIVQDLEGCIGFMWHWHHTDYKAHILARQLTHTLEIKGIKIFPSLDTCWHFDDKIAQKYLFESLNLPYIKTEVFYDKKDAIKWVNETTFPKVFKLKGGAGSSNVVLIKNKNDAIKKINIAFKRGFNLVERSSYFKRKLYNFKNDKTWKNFLKLNKGIYKYLFPNKENYLLPVQKGYVYFQDFVDNNTYDTRTVTIGERTLGVRRYNRQNDFRASGSGKVRFTRELIDIEAVKLSFKIAKKLNSQSLACDFIYENDMLKIVEISYGIKAGLPSEDFMGYWDDSLNWYEGGFKVEYWMIEDFINSLKK